MLKRTLQMSLLGIIALLTLAFTASPAQAQELYITERLTEFRGLQGSPATLAQLQRKLQQGVWVLFPDGTFLFTTVEDLNLGVPHKVGTYSMQGATAHFKGMSGSLISGTQVFGALVRGNQPTVSMDTVQIGTGAGVGIGGGLGFSSVIHYRVGATLRRLR